MYVFRHGYGLIPPLVRVFLLFSFDLSDPPASPRPAPAKRQRWMMMILSDVPKSRTSGAGLTEPSAIVLHVFKLSLSATRPLPLPGYDGKEARKMSIRRWVDSSSLALCSAVCTYIRAGSVTCGRTYGHMADVGLGRVVWFQQVRYLIIDPDGAARRRARVFGRAGYIATLHILRLSYGKMIDEADRGRGRGDLTNVVQWRDRIGLDGMGRDGM